MTSLVAGPGDNVEQVFQWYFSGDANAIISTGNEDFRMNAEGAAHVRGHGAGVLVTARRTIDLANAWGGKHPMDVPVVVVTHTVPSEWAAKKDSHFTFVTE